MIRPARGLAEKMDAFEPNMIHVATEGPLGWAARSYCLKNGLRFTTAFHTRFPEILNAALKIPLAWGYALFRYFHKASAGVMVPTNGVLNMLQQRGFRNLRSWTHGVDTQLFLFQPQPRLYPPMGTLVRPVSLFVGRVSYEKNIEAFLKLDIPGTKVVCGVGPLEVATWCRPDQAAVPRAPTWVLCRSRVVSRLCHKLTRHSRLILPVLVQGSCPRLL